MPLTTVKQRTNTGKTAGAAVVVGDYDGLVGSSTPVFADDGGNIVVDIGATPTGASAMVMDMSQGDSKFAQMTLDIKFTVAPSVALVVSEIRNSTAKIANILASVSGGNPTLLMRGGNDVALTGWTTSVVLALNVWYRIEIAVEVGAGTTDGKTKAKLTRLSDSVVLATGESTTLNSGTTNVHHHQTGKVSNTGTVGLLFDNLAFWDTAYAYISSAVDVADAGPDQAVEPWSSVVLTGNTMGTWTQDSGTAVSLSGTGLTRTFTAPALMNGGILIFTLTATAGGSTDSTMTTVLSCNEWFMHADSTLHPLQITN